MNTKYILKVLIALILVSLSYLMIEVLQYKAADSVVMGEAATWILLYTGVLYYVITPFFQHYYDIVAFKFVCNSALKRKTCINKKVSNIINNYYYSEDTYDRIAIITEADGHYKSYLLSKLNILRYVATCVMYLIVLSRINVYLLIPYFIMVVLCYSIKYMHARKQIDTEISSVPEDREADYFCEVLLDPNKMRDIKISRYENEIVLKEGFLFNSGLKKRYKLRRENGLKYPLMSSLISIVSILALVIGVIATSGSVAGVVALVSVFIKTLAAVDPLMEETEEYIESKGFVDEADEAIEQMNNAYNNDGVVIEKIQSIRFENVCFSYDNDNYVFYGLNFEWKQGERLCIVGENGAGKTTFLKLLLGINRPDKGTVYVNDTDLKVINYKSYISAFGVCMQSGACFMDSIKNNVSFGKEIVNEKCIELISFADCMEHGIESVIGQGGEDNIENDLSGGEVQRILLARAYMTPNAIFAFDEPTAALDLTSEYDFYKSVETEAYNKPMIFITHRLGFAKMADKIAVMQDGKIIEYGTHNQLLENNGLYLQMYKMQRNMYK